MQIAVVGAGAMGTLLGHGFSRAGHKVTALDLPERVAQLQASGTFAVASIEGGVTEAECSMATTDFSVAGPQDIIVLATKSQDLPGVAQGVAQIALNDTPIVTIQNGLPWWYLYGLPTNLETSRISCLDPDGLLERHINPSNVVGCVAYPAAELLPGGVSRHVEGFRLPVGELDGTTRDRTLKVSSALEDAGFKSRIIDDVRSEIWLKAWGALSINPISALARATMVEICQFSETRDLVAQMMQEAQLVAEAIGASLRHTIDKRISGAEAVGAHKTSMLQDVESGRTLELDALMLAVIELANLMGKDVPTIRNIYACAALLNTTLPRAPVASVNQHQ